MRNPSFGMSAIEVAAIAVYKAEQSLKAHYDDSCDDNLGDVINLISEARKALDKAIEESGML